MFLSDFDYNLPEELIALNPLKRREEANLFYQGETKKISDLPDIFKSGDVVVFNNTSVIPARLFSTCKKFEVMLNKKHSDSEWECFIRNAKKIKINDVVYISDDFYFTLISKSDLGCLIKFNTSGAELFDKIKIYGQVPLPPYITKKRELVSEDNSNYQSVFAKHDGAVAAPTASLHFTDSLVKRIKEKGVSFLEVTLHVGAGTYLPVRSENINEHKMHSEYGEISKETTRAINLAKFKGNRIISVGTTPMRILESAWNNELEAFSGETDIFITPGFKFNVVDSLITNFHLPKSTLLMLISAFYGVDEVKQMYKYAVENKFRFFSYGDACWLDRK